MRVHCHEHPNKPMKRLSVGYEGDKLISIRYECLICKKKIDIILNEKIVLKKGIEYL